MKHWSSSHFIHNKPWQNPTIPLDHKFTTNLKKTKTPTYIKKKQQRKREKKQTYLLAIEIPNHNKILKLLQLLKKLQPAFMWNWWDAEKEENPQLSFCMGVFVVGQTTITFSPLFLLVLNFSLIFSTDLNQRYLVILTCGETLTSLQYVISLFQRTDYSVGRKKLMYFWRRSCRKAKALCAPNQIPRPLKEQLQFWRMDIWQAI
jgi:hypothetical protein